MPDFPTILLVDDEDAVQKLLTYPLEREGYRVVPARDGQEASIREFRSRVRALLRRAKLPPYQGEGGDEVISTDGLEIDLARRTVEVGDTPVQLTYVEFELLRTLAAAPGRVFSRRMLLEELWGGAEYREPRTIDVHVRHLREKLERDPAEPEFIHTVRGVGYRFRES